MRKIVLAIAVALMSLFSSSAWAGGLLTNTNSSVAFMRSFAREGVIDNDGVYFNPAGVAFLSKGFHFSGSIQNVYQTRTIESGMTIPSMEGTPYYQPFKLNGGDENGVKKFEGKASVPVLPSFQAALVYDKWSFQLGFSLIGGGGKCTFNDGLSSFERQVALVPALLASSGFTTTTPGYSVQSYIKGQQYVFGTQFGVSYKVNKNFSVYAGMRFNYIYNKYQGNITNITANIDGQDENLYEYFGNKVSQANAAAAAYEAQAAATTDETTKAQLLAAAEQYKAASAKMGVVQDAVADKYLDCTQNGWGITPIIGIDYRIGKLNIGTRLEFTNHLNIENDTKRDDTGLFADGVNTPNDLPGIYALGAQYEVLPTLRVMASWHYYFDKDAKMANDKQELLSRNTQEYLGGVEWDVVKGLTVSAGGQITSYGLGDGSYLSDMSFVTSSYSIGFGAKFKISKKASVNIAYFWTDYDHFDKEYEQTYTVGSTSITATNTDRFTRSNRVLGAGIDIDF
jgi:long-chain fatty acid transport protein